MTSKRAERPNSIPWPPVVLACVIVAAITANLVYPLGWPGGPAGDILQGVGFFAIIVAAALYFLSGREMSRQRTTILPTKGADHLVTSGPFAVTRNPIYLANVIFLLGIGLAAGIVWFLPGAVICGFAEQKLAIEREEAHLEARFGKAWRDYKKKVRRWI